MTTDDLTQQGIAALKSGDKTQARKLLAAAIQQNPQNQVALLWLAGTIDNPDHQRQCLERAIAIDPHSHSGQMAARGLQKLVGREQPEPAPAQPASTHHETPPTEAPATAVETPPTHEEEVSTAPLPDAEVQPHAGAQPAETVPLPTPGEIQSLPSAAAPANEAVPPPSAPLTDPPPLSPPPSASYTPQAEAKRSTPAWVWVVAVLALITLVPCFCIGGIGVLTLFGNKVSEVPPSLPITNLVPFTHEETGISGMRPENWEILSTEEDTFFEASSSLDAPDDFATWVMFPDEFPAGDIAQASSEFFDSFKINHDDAPPPEIITEDVFDDGSGTLLISYSDWDWTETEMMRFTAYARTQPVAQGLLVAFAVVPADQFFEQEERIRTMVDSVDAQ